MKKVFSILLLVFLSLSCSKDSINNNNPYLPTYRFTSSTINLNLPLYSPLLSPGNPITYYESNVGIQGKIFIMYTGSMYVAFDAVCPNQSITSCSSMNLSGIKAVCDCDGAEYSLFSGQATGKQYPMVQYRVEQLSATSIRVYN